MTTLDNSMEFETGANENGMSRRSVVRAGAIGAAAVPAITIATAAPALAATSSPTSGATTLSARLNARRSGKTMSLTVTITNTGTLDTTALAVNITVDALTQLPILSLLPVGGNLLGGSVKDASTSVPAGWSASKTGSMVPLAGDLTDALLGTATFRYVADTQLKAGLTTVLSATLTMPTSRVGYLVAGTANPGSGVPSILADVTA